MGYNKKLTEKDIIKKVEELGYEFILMERKKDDKNRGYIEVTVKCKNNHISIRKWDNIREGHKCKYCIGNVKFTIEEVKEYIKSFGYELLSDEYKNKDGDVEIMCDKGHIYKTPYNVFRRGFRCPTCSGKKKYTIEEVKEIIENENYKLISTEYKNALSKILIQCDKGHESYEVKFSDFNNNGRRCPYCNESKGEKRVKEWLNKNNIKHIHDSEYFKDLLSPKGNHLRPDFILPNKKIWIEYDGEFHFRKVYKNDNYEILIIHDEIKNQYAIDNEWKLIRIPYWDFENIEKILNENVK